MRVLGIAPGLTRCGLGVVEGTVGRPLTLVDVNVVRTSADLPIAQRLVTIEKGIDAWLDEWVYGLANHSEYVEKMGPVLWDSLRPEPALSGQVDYGRYA